MSWLLENWDEVIAIALAIVGAAAMVAKLTPTPRDDTIIGKISQIINVLGMNFGKTANKG